MTIAGGVLVGAGSRLLPASIPFRFFGAAVAFQLVAWLAALAGADALPAFRGGLGWPLAALHAVTLGVLAMTAIGASLQLFPVATRRPVAHGRVAAAIFWTYVPGVTVLVAGMGLASPALMAAGGTAVALALFAFIFVLGQNLAGAKGLPLVVAHGGVATVALVATLVTAGLAVAIYAGYAPLSRSTVLALHVALATYGFMGMLALGLSHVLVPMFALGDPVDAVRGWTSFALAVVALALAIAASLDGMPTGLAAAAAGIGLVAAILHVLSMRGVLARGLRRELGTGFKLVTFAWAAMIASLALALAVALGLDAPGLVTLFGATLVAGWLLTFVLGILSRIVPFLAAMHAGRGRRRPPTPSSLTDERALTAHARLHVAALALLALAIVLDDGRVALAAAAAGSLAAIAYAVFFTRAARAIAHPIPDAAPRAPTP